MNTAANTSINESDFFQQNDQAGQVQLEEVASQSTSPASDENSGNSANTGDDYKSHCDALKKSTRDVVKLYECITGHETLSQAQRDRVRDLINKQSAALDMKLSGQQPEEGMDFESIAKVLRKENNKLDSLLEGKESLFKKFHEASKATAVALKLLQENIQKLEDES